ncbi:DUF4181 domain-containing protein [Metabacillus sp. HB246100]
MWIVFVLLFCGIVEFIMRRRLKIKNRGFFVRYEFHSIKLEKIDRFCSGIFILLVIFAILFSFPLTIMVFGYLLITTFIRGIDEWTYERKTKEFMLTWSASGVFFLFCIYYASDLIK